MPAQNGVMMQYFHWHRAGDGYDVGYGVYDTYDLGEFDQKGSVRTKYGTRKEYLAAIKALQKHGIQALGVRVAFRPFRRGEDERRRLGRVPLQRRAGVRLGARLVAPAEFH